MITFPIQALPLIESLMVEIAANCRLEKSPLQVYNWTISSAARESLSTLMQLPCVPNHYSISKLTSDISNYEIDFSDSVSLV